MKNISIKLLSILSVAMICFSACDDDPPPPNKPNEQEVITAVRLYLEPVGGGISINYLWSDSDGVGGKPPVFDTLRLQTGKTYDGQLQLFDVTKVPTDTLTDDVKVEENAHQFFYKVQGMLINYATVSRMDKDNNGLPVGLKIRIVSSASGTGSLNIKLYHYDGVIKTDQPSMETDMDIDVPLSVQ